MNKSIALFIAGLCSLSACNYENYDDCHDDDFEFEDDFAGGHSRAGKPGAAGSEATGGSTGSGAAASEGGTTPVLPEPPEPPATPCEVEHDCPPGFNCDLDAQICVAADAETCGELLAEAECAARADCTPIYGGTNCSCGADCECQGGEPGCICETFQFFVCQHAAAPVE
jgi:hypothetical protein